MKKIIISAIFCLLLFSGITASAATHGNLTYTVSNGEVTITDCKESASGKVVIPEKINGYMVTSIGERAFYWCDSLTSITIPDSVTSIGDLAFSWCSSLTSITIPEGVTSIGEMAFVGCSSLTSITIPEGVTSIGETAFGSCSSLTSITIPDSVTSIGETAFGGCSSLTSITIPEGVTSIGESAFCLCRSLTSITIPDGVTSIGDEAFGGCSSLTSITIPDGVTSIGDEAFCGCSSLTSITIPDSVTSIGDDAFYGCRNLKTVYKPLSAKWSYSFGSGVEIIYTKVSCTVSYTGDCTETITADYGTTVTLPVPPTGYTYAFTADGKEWDGYVTGDMTVTVTKIPIKYTIKYTGVYNETIVADYASTVVLPSEYGYIYTFTANGKEWDGYVTGDLTVTVTKVCDLAEVIGIGLDNVSIDGSNITGEWLWEVFDGEIAVSDGASYVIYDSKECVNAVDSLVLSEKTQYYIKVTAESGSERLYTLNVTRSAPKTLGTLTIEQISGGSLVMSVENKVPGKPRLALVYGEEMYSLTDFVLAEYDEVSGKLYAKGLPEDREYYFMVIAWYDDIEAHSSIVLARTGITLSSDCYVIRTLTPPGGKIVHAENESGTGSISGLRVINSYESVEIDVEVSAGATWGLYRTKTSTTPIEKNINLANYAGRTITRYIRVKSEDGEHERIYSIELYRQSKSSEPQITLSGNKVTITAEGETILYTTDKSVPGEENENTNVYTGPFAVSGGTVIKAIAKESDKDEYSDMVTYTVPARLEAAIVPLDMFRSGKEYIYAFNVESEQEVSGEFIICLYDELGGLVAAEIQSIDKEREYCAEGVIVSDMVATDFKALLLSDMATMTPLAEFADGKID